MSAPELSSIAQALYDAARPQAIDEEENGYGLAYFLSGLGLTIQEIDDAVEPESGLPPYVVVLDVDTIPAAALGWLAQFVGVRLRVGLSDADQRARVKSTDGFNRGAPAAMVGAAVALLTGTKTVTFRERDTSPYHLTAITYTSETPDSALVLEALLSEKPGGVQMNYEVLDGWDLEEVYETEATFQDIYDDFSTGVGLMDHIPGS